MIGRTGVNRAASQTVDGEISGVVDVAHSQWVPIGLAACIKAMLERTAHNSQSVSQSVGPNCQPARRQAGDVCFTRLGAVSSLLFHCADESAEPVTMNS